MAKIKFDESSIDKHYAKANKTAKHKALKEKTSPDHAAKDCGYKCVFHNKGVKHVE